MKIKKALYLALPLLIVWIALIPVGDKTYVFRCVLPPDKLEINEHVISINNLTDKNKDFIVKGDKLYLRYQTVRHSLLFVSYVSDFLWTKEKLEQLKENNPYLSEMWDKNSSGVYWIKDK